MIKSNFYIPVYDVGNAVLHDTSARHQLLIISFIDVKDEVGHFNWIYKHYKQTEYAIRSNISDLFYEQETSQQRE